MLGEEKRIVGIIAFILSYRHLQNHLDMGGFDSILSTLSQIRTRDINPQWFLELLNSTKVGAE
jgi:hypothetical protein